VQPHRLAAVRARNQPEKTLYEQTAAITQFGDALHGSFA